MAVEANVGAARGVAPATIGTIWLVTLVSTGGGEPVDARASFAAVDTQVIRLEADSPPGDPRPPGTGTPAAATAGTPVPIPP